MPGFLTGERVAHFLMRLSDDGEEVASTLMGVWLQLLSVVLARSGQKIHFMAVKSIRKCLTQPALTIWVDEEDELLYRNL